MKDLDISKLSQSWWSRLTDAERTYLMIKHGDSRFGRGTILIDHPDKATSPEIEKIWKSYYKVDNPLQDLLKKMEERKIYLENSKKIEGHPFDPNERLGELTIWILEMNELIKLTYCNDLKSVCNCDDDDLELCNGPYKSCTKCGKLHSAWKKIKE